MLAQLIAHADTAHENLKNNTKSLHNTEDLEMAKQSANFLGIDRCESHYSIQERKKKLESYGYQLMTIDDISKELFGEICSIQNCRDCYFPAAKEGHHFTTTRNGYRQVFTKYFTPISTDRGYCDKVILSKKFTKTFATPGMFKSRTETKTEVVGFISSPNYLISPIPPAILGRMESLAKTGLINCFLAAGPTEVFNFENEVEPQVIDPIILAVIDNSFGVCSPLNPETYMYFVGKYN